MFYISHNYNLIFVFYHMKKKIMCIVVYTFFRIYHKVYNQNQTINALFDNVSWYQSFSWNNFYIQHIYNLLCAFSYLTLS